MSMFSISLSIFKRKLWKKLFHFRLPVVAEYKQCVGPFAVWRDSCTSSLSLLPMSLWKWPLQICARTWCLENLLGNVFTKFVIHFGEEISDFRSCWGHFSLMEIWAYFENFLIGRPTKVKPFRCPTSHYREGVGVVALENEG